MYAAVLLLSEHTERGTATSTFARNSGKDEIRLSQRSRSGDSSEKTNCNEVVGDTMKSCMHRVLLTELRSTEMPPVCLLQAQK